MHIMHEDDPGLKVLAAELALEARTLREKRRVVSILLKRLPSRASRRRVIIAAAGGDRIARGRVLSARPQR